ncbi:hypothetical protein [Streptomyces zaomyceticus]|uniref:hypothetical protein n=1 Tax=Streptomyces zaomyceticus TaxID=68286 RepID=UPI003445CD50
MRRLFAVVGVVALSMACAMGVATGITALLDTVPEQPNVPLVTYETGPSER